MKVYTLDEKAQALDRLMRQKDVSPFVLVLDSVLKPAIQLIAEFERRLEKSCRIVHLRLEFHPGEQRTEPRAALDVLKQALSKPLQGPKRTMVIVDNLNRLEEAGLSLQHIIGPETSVLGVYHKDISQTESYGPSNEALIRYMATSVIEINRSGNALRSIVDDPLQRVLYRENDHKLNVTLTHRKKSGKAIVADYLIDPTDHTIEFVPPKSNDLPEESVDQLAGLTTFNLGTNEKQKHDREKVDLPFLAAQTIGDGGAQGGAIIYEFEKDDDYDEEDPYEDPF